VRSARTPRIQLALDIQEALARHVLERGCQVSINIQGGIQNAWTNFKSELTERKQGEKFTSAYVHKHLFFEVVPPRSPDLKPLNFYLWRHLKPTVYSASIDDEETLHQRDFDACRTIRKRSGTLERVRQAMIRRVHACVDLGEDVLRFCCEF
jgi:hypothetical protein